MITAMTATAIEMKKVTCLGGVSRSIVLFPPCEAPKWAGATLASAEFDSDRLLKVWAALLSHPGRLPLANSAPKHSGNGRETSGDRGKEAVNTMVKSICWRLPYRAILDPARKGVMCKWLL